MDGYDDWKLANADDERDTRTRAQLRRDAREREADEYADRMMDAGAVDRAIERYDMGD